MGQYLDLIVSVSERTLGYADKVLAGINPADFARKPRLHDAQGRPVTIDCNHPAWVVGHLSIYPARVAGLLGLDPSGVAAPPAWTDLFKATSECKDDPEGAIYPAAGELTRACFHGYRTLHAMARAVPDETLLAQPPDERTRSFFTTIGAATFFLLNNHIAMHLGQLSTWRRCMGLGPAM
ncbi:MAG: DinB family protein [Phycisphaeraceae bacterium]|nr:MAG: DinB family protein [Phycisphaeraceae bacterium]